MTSPSGVSDRALIVGVRWYDADSDYRSLKGPPHDCKEFRRWLLDHAGVLSENIHSVVWSAAKEMPYPKSSDVGSALSLLLRPANRNDVEGGRRLYLFSAGHCQATSDLEANVITADARPPVAASFPITRVAHLIRRSGLFEEIVLFVDGCRNSPMEPDSPYPLRLPTGPHDTHVLYAFACEFGRAAYERKFGRQYNGVFSKALMEGLRGAASTKLQRITGNSLKRFLQARIPQLQERHLEQTPEIYCPRPFVLL